jgi:hypothetical protein
MHRLLRSCLAVGAIACLLATGAHAQTTTGRISGTVSDASGAVLPGVTVTVTEATTAFTKSAITDSRGSYVFVDLPRGTYNVVAELTGFKKGVKNGYSLVADGRVTVNFSLSVGTVSESIEVTAPGETVNTLSGEVGRTVDREQVSNLALNGRNYMQLATLIPGTPVLDTNPLELMVGLGINTSINGSRTNTSLLMVDGGFNMDSGSNNSQISNVGIDFIEEVNIKTANFSAEYGRNSGASINVITRGGSNRLRGSVFEYTRDERFDANDYFANARDVDKAPLSYHNYGWRLGGAIKKDKLFFSVGEEWKRIRRLTSANLRTLPTSAMRAGNFSHLTTALRDPLTGQPFPGNIIPANRITADGRAFANVYASAAQQARSYNDSPIANNALFQDDFPFDWRQDQVRLDWQATQSQRLTVRVLYDDYVTGDPYGTFIGSQLPTSPTSRDRPGRNWQINHSWTLRPNLINEFKANAAWNGQRIPPVGDVWKRETYGFAFPQLFTGGGRFENSIPDISTMTGFATFQGAARSLISPTTDIQFGDSLSWIKDRHTLKFGALVIRNRKDQNGRSTYAGQLAFNPAGNPNSTGNAFADALLGNFRTYTEFASDPMGFFRFWQGEGYVSDNWRVTHSLSVEAGVRYTLHVPINLQANNMANFDPASYDPSRAVTILPNGNLVPGSGNPLNGLVRAGTGVPESELGRVPNGNSPSVLAVPAGAPRGLYHSQHLLGPRFSFAWAPKGKNNMAIRGGIGLYFDRPEGNLYFGGTGNGPVNSPPYVVSAQYENGNLASPGGGSVPAPAPLGALAAIDPDLKVPREWKWSITVQRELPWGIFGEIGYIGAKGQYLLRQPDINQAPFEALLANNLLPAAQRVSVNSLRPYKGYSTIGMRLSDADSQYKALQLYLARRRGQLTGTVSYTLGSAKDNASGNGDDPEDYLNKDFNWGPSSFNRRHIVVTTWTWKVPFFKKEQGIGRFLGGWQISGIGRYQSGAPLSITGNTTIGGRRADFNGDDPYFSEAERFGSGLAVVQWLKREPFASSPDSRRGNSTKGQFTGPSYKIVDLAFRKGFRLRKDMRLTFQADLFNALNQTNFTTIQTNLANADFGRLTAVAPPRNVQLGLRFEF